MNLPDVFYFEVYGCAYRMTKVCAHTWNVVEYSNIDDPKAIRSDWPENEIVENLEGGVWKMVDEPVKDTPDEFYFEHKHYPGDVHHAKRQGHSYLVTWKSNHKEDHLVEDVKEFVNVYGWWRILDKQPLSAEQQKAVKQMKEQVAALESSIKLNEQDISHKERLIASYNERKDVLLGKISELEGA